MSMGCDGKTFYVYFTCRYDEGRYEARVPIDSTDTVESVAKKIQARMNEIELEEIRKDMRGFIFFKKGEDNGTIS